MSLLAAVIETGVVGWRPHLEVWVLVAGAIAIGLYTSRVIQPAAVTAGHPPISRNQKVWFVLAVAGTWLASDWPVHDVAEEQLYWVHMAQHMVLSFALPAMFLLACPRWLLQLVIPEGGRIWSLLRTGSRPIVAGVVFNALSALLHLTDVVEISLANGAVHFALHLAVFLSGVLMWMPVCGPVQEWRLSPPGQMVYLFIMSVMPTVPGGWLVFAETVVYKDYDTPGRLWGMSALEDQQLAGVVMKLGGGTFLWAVILVLFFRWAAAEERDRTARQRQRRVPAPVKAGSSVPAAGVGSAPRSSELTFEEVSRAFARSEPPPDEG